MLKKYFWSVLFFGVVLAGVLGSGCSAQTMDEVEAQKVLNDFYMDKVPESINDRHLLNAGKAIVPYLIVEIQNENMPKRGYAILALGKIGDRRALPVLTRMFENPVETKVHPSDSLRAIWYIDRKLGEEFASKYTGNDELTLRSIELLRKGIM